MGTREHKSKRNRSTSSSRSISVKKQKQKSRRSRSKDKKSRDRRSKSKDRRSKSRDRRSKSRDRSRERRRSKSRNKRSRSRSHKRKNDKKKHEKKKRSRSRSESNEKQKKVQARLKALMEDLKENNEQEEIQEEILPPSIPQQIIDEDILKKMKNEEQWIDEDEDNNNQNHVNGKIQNKEEESEDELDAYMKSLAPQVVEQEKITTSGNFYKALMNVGVQSNKNYQTTINHQSVMMPEDYFPDAQYGDDGQLIVDLDQPIEYKIKDTSKIITWDDLQNMNDNEKQQEDINNDEEEDKFHQEFQKALKQKRDEERFGEKEELLSEEETYHADFQLKEDVDPDEYGYMQALQKKEQRKQLTSINHEMIEYEQFRKNFYVAPKEHQGLTLEQQYDFRNEFGDIKVRGKDCPLPISDWYQCGLSDKLLKFLIEKRLFKKPFAIQSQAIPVIMSGRDAIGIAETGSGKTLAYLLPMLRHIMDQRPIHEGDGPIGIVIAPTRELCTQIYFECKSFCKYLGLNSVCVYGGTGIQGQLTDLKRGCEIVVCTPGRMIDVLCTSNGKITNLQRCTYVVLDEADRMFDMGFEPQITKILSQIRPDRQTVMFSATFPRNIDKLARNILQKPIEIVVGSRGQACQNVEQIVEMMEETDKFWRLLELLGEYVDKGSILIFVDKQSEADELFKELLKYNYKPLVIHGGQDQTDREFTIQDFKKGVRNIMVATSVCARGLDISHLILVINFKCPGHLEDYVHRIGRTGRAGNQGTAITFFTKNDENFAPELLNIIKQSKVSEVPPALEHLAEEFMEKVKLGEAKHYVNKNISGSGFKFDEEECKKGMDEKKVFKRQYDLETHVDDDGVNDDEIFKKKDGPLSEREKEEMAKYDKKIAKQCIEMIKDPKVKKAVMTAATRASQEAIRQGKSSKDVLAAAQQAIKKLIQNFKPGGGELDVGMQNLMAVKEEILDLEIEQSDKVTAEFEINDYPLHARQKVTKPLLKRKKKTPFGTKKLYLLIMGENKFQVSSAYREIKRVIEEISMSSLNNPNQQGNQQQQQQQPQQQLLQQQPQQ